MVAHMHPRSRTTVGLFGTTLAVAFLVVGLPHVLPCPVPRRALAETEFTDDGRRRRRRKAATAATVAEKDDGGNTDGNCSSASSPQYKELGSDSETVIAPSFPGSAQSGQRECPVPKPGGLLGQVLGFKKDKDQTQGPVEVKIEARR